MLQDAIQHEKYEWANIWWDCANDLDSDRVLLIGDSISVGYSQTVIDFFKETVHVDRLSTSRGINDPAYFKELAYMLGEFDYKVIHFNNGLHGFHIPDDVYERGLTQMVQMLKKYSRGAKLVWASSTPVTIEGDPTAVDPEKNAIVIARNAIAADVMQKYEIPIDDLYSVAFGRAELRLDDGYHYNPDGEVVLGESVIKSIQSIL